MHIFNTRVDELQITHTFFTETDKKKLFLHVQGKGKTLTLSRAVPILENLNLSIAQCNLIEKENDCWELVFEVQGSPLKANSDESYKRDIEQFLTQLLSDNAENDTLNKLALSSNISIHYLVVLRAFSKYLQQIQINYSIDILYKCLVKHQVVTELFTEYFQTKFKPIPLDSRDSRLNNIEAKIHQCIDGIHGRDDDLICRRYFSVLKATTRTNFYKAIQRDNTHALSFKIEPLSIEGIPKPVPAYEIFIYSQFVEGVHLRGGKVSRGGLRFSDRPEDYRTEVLGLVKAQMVKNSVIVPVGAKGGFICKIDLMNTSKQDFMAYSKASYEIFIRALLDITDNRINGHTVSPENVVCYDDEDPYLVVAADKGTATFSDFANSIAQEYQYWLGDAFASGGEYGYDHKKMGITAKGAWESARRLLIEVGKNIHTDTISVVGIGDMSGDVFGNGMLLSKHLQLVAAFNHKHIFIDPNPHTEISYNERQRLFELPHSSWIDYDTEKLSPGGAIFDRSQKHITLSLEAAERLGIDDSQLIMTPDELIKIILLSPVDMLWNGGIGTYVKAFDETDLDVSDKTNDRLRVNALNLRCRIVVEGGNLGLTQKARIEYALNGGLIHMDAVDNAGGVDCSDHEVNIKILLEDIIKDGIITREQRNNLLASMADSVSQLVLNNNFRQSKMLSQSNYTAPHFFDSFVQLINLLERESVLDRELACIPSPEQIDTRIAAQQSFTRPELATLLAYSKSRLFNKLVESDLIEDDFFQTLLLNYFPEKLVTLYSSYIKKHPLRKEILASYLTNDIANRMGATFCNYTLEENTNNITQLVKAHMIAVEIFDVNGLYRSIDDLCYTTKSSTLLDLQLAIHYPLDKAMSWLMQQGIDGELTDIIESYRPILHTLKENLAHYLPEKDYEYFQSIAKNRASEGVTLSLAEDVYRLNYFYNVLPLASVAKDLALDTHHVLHHFFNISEELSIFWLYQVIEKISIDDNWKRRNKKMLIADIENYHIKALRQVLLSTDKDSTVKSVKEVLPNLHHYFDIINIAKNNPNYSFPMMTILVSKLGQLVN